MNSFDLWNIKRIQKDKISHEPEQTDVVTIDENNKIPKSGKTKRKRSCKRKNKNLKIMMGSNDEEDEQIFNDGDGLIVDSDNEIQNDDQNLKEDSTIIKME